MSLRVGGTEELLFESDRPIHLLGAYGHSIVTMRQTQDARWDLYVQLGDQDQLLATDLAPPVAQSSQPMEDGWISVAMNGEDCQLLVVHATPDEAAVLTGSEESCLHPTLRRTDDRWLLAYTAMVAKDKGKRRNAMVSELPFDWSKQIQASVD